ncbi:MAG: glycosyl transferase family protein [Candidatus Paceibacter sp.]|jgi:4-amino-4-deoxy-L-arabinose transferase-like glycosyltransferase|nr:glycosyl transferase family protein [Candidatus Paceibacter sp.]
MNYRTALSHHLDRLLAIGIIALSVTLSIGSLWNESFVVDEIPFIGAGYSYLAKHDMRFSPEHPPLAKDVGALPLILMNINGDTAFESSYWTTPNKEQWNAPQWYFGQTLIYKSANDVVAITRAAKTAMLIFFVGSAWIIYMWAKRYGRTIALICLCLFAFSPTVIAHGHLVTTDMAALFGVVSASYFFIRYIKDQSLKNFCLAGLFFGIALLTKFSTVLLIPIFLGLGFLWGYLVEEKHQLHEKLLSGLKLSVLITGIMLTGFVCITYTVYWFHTLGYPVDRQISDFQIILGDKRSTSLGTISMYLVEHTWSRPLAQYLIGLVLIFSRATNTVDSYFFGNIYTEGNAWYFPLVYMLKEQLIWLLIGGFGIALVVWRSVIKIKNKLFFTKKFLLDHIDEVFMIAWLGLYWMMSIMSPLNIGIRHILPVYPFMILLAGAGLTVLISKTKIKKIVVALAVVYIGVAVAIFPHYLSYFNSFAGGQDHARKIFIDSNLDWGQDLPRFATWLQKNNIQNIDLDYFGWADPKFYIPTGFTRIDHSTYKNKQDFLDRNTSNDWIAVSVQNLEDSIARRETQSPNYSWLDTEKPAAIIGHSIRIYHFD